MKRCPAPRYLPLFDDPVTFPEAILLFRPSRAAASELSRRLRERNNNSLVNLQMKDLAHGVVTLQPVRI